MNKNVKIGSGNVVTLTAKDYRASGGEGEIYAKINANGGGNTAFKCYHDPTKKIFPKSKLDELAKINNPNVITPQELLYDVSTGAPIGYTTKFVSDVEPLLKFFTRSFKTDNNIDYKMINELVKQMQIITTQIHSAKCLIVDYNELNVLVSINNTLLTPYYIDTDSYATPSFKATAIMDSVRDRKATTFDKNGAMHYHPTEGSDWFSFAVLSFWLYSNIHAFRGAHSNYKPNQKKQQMDDGISIFHPGVRVPPSVNNFNVIPQRHLDWFKQVFLNGERGIPPMPDSNIPTLVPTQIITIKGSDKLTVTEIHSYDDNIIAIQSIMGVYYVATKKKIYANKKELGTHKSQKISLCSANDGTLIVASQKNNDTIEFSEIVSKSNVVGRISSLHMFSRNNAIYTMSKGNLIENTFISFNNRIIHKTNTIENVSYNSSYMYDGCVIQNLLGKTFLTLPYKLGNCFSKHIPAVDGYRVIDAKADKNVIIIIGEKSGQYDRFIIIFNKEYTSFDIRKVEDIAYDTINFTCMDNRMSILLATPTDLELFSTTNQIDIISNPPFDSTMKLFSTSDGIFFINNNSFHQLKKK